MNYKKIIPKRNLRLKLLRFSQIIPDKQMVKIQYKIKTGRKLDLNDPKRFTEKLQWYKLYYRNPLMHKCVDKIDARDYISEKGLGNILVPLIGIYTNPDDIDLKSLPPKFIMKISNSSHANIICKDKTNMSEKFSKKQLKKWMKGKPGISGREWAYYKNPPRVLIETLLEDKNNPNDDIRDYKFICFDGEVKYIWVDIDRYSDHKRNYYDRNWNFLDIQDDLPNSGDNVEKPAELNEMIRISEILSKPFPHVRVDLYYINQKIYFGEMTFYLLSGYQNYLPDQFDFDIGEKFRLPMDSDYIVKK